MPDRRPFVIIIMEEVHGSRSQAFRVGCATKLGVLSRFLVKTISGRYNVTLCAALNNSARVLKEGRIKIRKHLPPTHLLSVLDTLRENRVKPDNVLRGLVLCPPNYQASHGTSNLIRSKAIKKFACLKT
jgi:hypothetical protein